VTPEETRSSVAVTTRSFGSGDADPAGLLRKAGLRVTHADPAHGHAALEETLSVAVAWIAGTSPIDDRHLAAAPNLKIVARHGTGYDSVDLAAAARRGVIVTNTPGANAEAVADHTLGLMLAALRHLVAGDRASHEGVRPLLRGRELGALTVGIIGCGSIGRAVARRLIGGFGARVLAYDPFVVPERVREAGIESVGDLSGLTRAADVLTLHMPGGGSAVVDATFLSHIRPGAVLINTARGDLLDEEAVAGALAEGRLAAAAVDVLASEPATSSPLLNAPNAIVTPHIAAQTTQAIDRMGMMAAEEVVRVLAGEAPRHPVAVPT
jgi:D-3-phosphoglycerate dehydrogenase